MVIHTMAMPRRDHDILGNRSAQHQPQPATCGPSVLAWTIAPANARTFGIDVCD